MEAFAGYTAFTMDIIAKRRAEPTEDLFSILVNSEVEGQRMSDDEIVMETLLILIGGDETTRHTLSGGTEQLLRHRDQWDAAGRPIRTLLPGAIEEMLRWTSPVKNMCRTLTADTEFHGTELRGRREDHADVRSRPTSTRRCSAIRRTSASTGTRTATWPSASARTSAWAISWLASSCD